MRPYALLTGRIMSHYVYFMWNACICFLSNIVKIPSEFPLKGYVFILGETVRVREGQSKRETESQAGFAVSAWSSMRGPVSWDSEIMTWAETKSRTLNHLSHPGAPYFYFIFFKVGSIPSEEPNTGLELTTLRSRPEFSSRVGNLTEWATQAPRWLYVLPRLIAARTWRQIINIFC